MIVLEGIVSLFRGILLFAMSVLRPLIVWPCMVLGPLCLLVAGFMYLADVKDELFHLMLGAGVLCVVVRGVYDPILKLLEGPPLPSPARISSERK